MTAVSTTEMHIICIGEIREYTAKNNNDFESSVDQIDEDNDEQLIDMNTLPPPIV